VSAFSPSVPFLLRPSNSSLSRRLAQKRNLSGDASAANPKFNIDDYLGDVSDPGASKLGGVTRRPSLDASTKRVGSTRVLYRVSKSTYPSLIRPREACVLQDSFTDESDGTVYIYEVSVLHHSVYGSKGHVTYDPPHNPKLVHNN
jgi:hypothetical protein